MTHASTLNDLIDLYAALRLDRHQDSEQKKMRDRRIGRALEHLRKRPDRQIQGWLQQVRIADFRREGWQGGRIYHLLCLLLVLMGLLTGWGLARTVLHYTGDLPINVVHALGILVVPQILLLPVWLLASLPWRIPVLGSLQSNLGLLNPGRLTRYLSGLFPVPGEQKLALLWDPEKASLLAPVSRWLFCYWSQIFAFTFNVGVLATLLYLITFSDLAFGWSTTLALDNTTFHRLLNTIAWPWHNLLPDAVPSTGLVEASRYFRLEDTSSPLVEGVLERASRLAQWWPFLAVSIVCYGLAPRLLTLLISRSRFHYHLADTLPRVPGAAELLARMNSPLISTHANQPEDVLVLDSGPEPNRPEGGYGLKCMLVDWSGTGIDQQSIAAPLGGMGIDVQGFVHAGGARTTTEDDAAIDSLCGSEPQGIAVVVKAWEPPLLEFLDFLHAVRGHCRRKQPIVVLLWGNRDAVSVQDRETWRLTLRQLNDPDLHIEVLV